MGFQRLLMAGLLLVAARTLMLVAVPSPILFDAGGGLSRGSEQMTGDRPLGNPLQPTIPEAVEQSPAPLAGEFRNPVQGWHPTPQTSTLCQTVKSAVVTVYAGREIGSGSIISSDGMVLTNFHVVRRLRRGAVAVELLNGTRYNGQVIAINQTHDLALLKLEVSDSLPTVPFARAQVASVGEPVCAIGSPFGSAGVVTEGKVTGIMPNGDTQSDVVLEPGNSGGPLLNAQGEMIGVNKGVARSRDENGDRVSFSTSAPVAQDFVEQNRIAPAARQRNFRSDDESSRDFSLPPAQFSNQR